MKMLGFLAVIVILLSFIPEVFLYPCPNDCSNQGVCNVINVCKCFPGFFGFDCSQRLCPSGKAWYDFPSEDNVAHAEYTECSNMGQCNRVTGECKCRWGFTGPACERMMCPLGSTSLANYRSSPCSGKGRCMSLASASKFKDSVTFYNDTTYSGWDMDMIHGCVCDPGWTGHDCSERSCIYGDDPLTPGVDEIQYIDCTCTSCFGGVYITFNNQRSALIPHNATDELIAYRLQQIATIEKVIVSIKKGSTFCSSHGSVTEVIFVFPQGPQPKLKANATDGFGSTISVYSAGAASSLDTSLVSQRGTKEYVECSNRGVCNRDTGICECYKDFSSSNGLGDAGQRPDCGYRNQSLITYIYNSSVVHTLCPHTVNGTCSGQGTCNTSTGVCTCDSGYEGPACEYISCGLAPAWFGSIPSNHSLYKTCAGVGKCDFHYGVCRDCGGIWGYYDGPNCEYLSCPTGAHKKTCSNNGVCLTMREMAPFKYDSQLTLAGVVYETPWDADMIRGCLCERAISVDNVYYPDYTNVILDAYSNKSTWDYSNPYIDIWTPRFYRGPYAQAASDYSGYNCGLALCPRGDNPTTYGDQNEIQMIRFWETNASATFTITFRENVTYPINCNDTLIALKYRLEQLYTIRKVEVYSNYYSPIICNTSTGRWSLGCYIFVEFIADFGDLPLMVANTTDMGSTGLITVYEYQKGNKEDVECSGIGLCNQYTGQCVCPPGYGSSNGSFWASGERGDCAFYNKYFTVLN